jgi:hypothetical protein
VRQCPAAFSMPMIILETVTPESATEHRCEALTISDIPPYRCTTSATADRRGRAVCASHARALRIRWFDDGDAVLAVTENHGSRPRP